MSEERTTQLEFPCAFPIKIMGEAKEGFADAMLEIVLRHAPDFDAASTEMKASSTGKYVSLTCTITAVSQAQLDELYREISGHTMVAMAL
jgi:putative lipoic acid-binding regulatory protein